MSGQIRVRFGEFTYDSRAQQVRTHDAPVPLSAKALAVLQFLLERRPGIVSKRELMDRVWPESAPTESNLFGLVAEIRRALHDDAQHPRFIRTVSGTGYAFFGDAVDLDATRRPRGRPSKLYWLEWDGQRQTLYEGETIVGRHPDSDIWIDDPKLGVSKAHARIVVSDNRVSIEDLNSLNGTWVGRARLDAPRVLADGDVIRFWKTSMTFRVRPTPDTVRQDPVD